MALFRTSWLFVTFSLYFFLAFAQSDSIPKQEQIPSDTLAGLLENDNFQPVTEIKIINGTFLGNEQRNFYGNEAPSRLDEIWKLHLGTGKTIISRSKGSRMWSGAGWTGQPLLVKENDTLYLIQGAYDHHLKKINAQTGKLVWQYKFDDVIKGTGTIWYNKNADSIEDAYVILQGSRLGVGNYLDSDHVPSYRAVSYINGKELWRFDQKWKASYSRDVDGSALVLNDTAYIGFENGLFTVFDPDHRNAEMKDNMLQPCIIQESLLYKEGDSTAHRGNLVTESSPSKLGNRLYVNSGSGRVYGYNLQTRELDWAFYTGSDMDGSAVVTRDSCLLIPVERQYIKGRGGLLKLDPSRHPDSAVVWFCPSANTDFAGWEGGIIGSPAVYYYADSSKNINLAAFMAIDGFLYVINPDEVDSGRLELGFDNKTFYHSPKIVFKYKMGPSISTPLLVGNKIIAAGYEGIFLFGYDERMQFKLLDSKPYEVEATPFVWNRKIYIASRNGYLYCFGEVGQ